MVLKQLIVTGFFIVGMVLEWLVIPCSLLLCSKWVALSDSFGINPVNETAMALGST